MRSALSIAQRVLEDVNEETRRFENIQKMSELSRIIDMEATGVSYGDMASCASLTQLSSAATKHHWPGIHHGWRSFQSQEWAKASWLFIQRYSLASRAIESAQS